MLSVVIGVIVGASAGGSGGSDHSSTATGSSGSEGKAKAGASTPAFQNAKLVHTQDPVPVLMYHVIANPPSGAALPDLYVDPKTFDQQMQWLKSQGYTAVTLDQVYDAWFKDAEIPEKPIVLSFDDGYRGQYVYARPELRKLGWPGVLSAISGRIGQPNAELSDAMVRRMVDDGWELDSHTIHHVDVTTLDASQLREEIGGSRRDLQQRFGQPVNFFCYPAGRYDAQAVAAVRAAGYLGATTTDEGLASKGEMYTLKRVRVDYSDGVSGLEQKLKDAGA